ncbi:MAG: hypothetical protein N3D10_00600 [Candidatus Micrarchaeota archaeon]|nr:hypothetical protein [Candidatus Micrarchaeota archaeon]
MAKIGQIFSLEILFASIILFLVVVSLQTLEKEGLEEEFLRTNIEKETDPFFYSLIKSKKIEQAIETNNYTYLNLEIEKRKGLCINFEIYNKTLNQSSMLYNYANNCTINKEDNNFVQKIFFDGGKKNNYYIIRVRAYRG